MTTQAASPTLASRCSAATTESVVTTWPNSAASVASHSVAGDIDLLVLVQADAPGALADRRERIASFKGVDDVTTMPVLRVTLDRR